MPTARELLEQADALMRRNRARDQAPPPVPAEPAPVVDNEVPELTEVAAMPAEAGPTPDALAEVVVPELAEASPDVPAVPAAADDAPPPVAPDAAVPPLREALARDLASPTAAYPPLPAAPMALDDIPELTEIVEEIEAPSILDASADFELGEPSVWMEPGHGEVSILGRWPDVPAAAADAGDHRGQAAGAADGAPEVGVLHVAPDLLDAALAAALPSNDVLARGILAAQTGPGVAPAAAETLERPFASGDEEAPAQDEPEATPAGDEAEVAWVEDEAEAVPIDDELEASTAEDEIEASTVEDEAEAAQAEAEAAPVDDQATKADRTVPTTAPDSAGFGPAAEAPVNDVAGLVDAFEASPAPTVPTPDEARAVPTGAALVVPSAAAIGIAAASPAELAVAAQETDAERWDRVAEEVRMQVLQRIDIFTDTGLQEQLARRLQPMVDRASADLVATINHHVGALMRAYVAEAIEREIEKWRAGSR